jgi:hypothetical protein
MLRPQLGGLIRRIRMVPEIAVLLPADVGDFI